MPVVSFYQQLLLSSTAKQKKQEKTYVTSISTFILWLIHCFVEYPLTFPKTGFPDYFNDLFQLERVHRKADE